MALESGGTAHVPADADLIEQIAVLARSMNGTVMHFDGPVTGETNIVRDLKLDSLATMDFIMALETKFDTIIPIDGMAHVETVRDLAELLQSQMTRTTH